MTTRIDPSTDVEHPIFDSAWDYEVIGLRLEKEPIEEAESFLDLMLRRGSDRCTFRFWSPSELEIDRGGPLTTGGLTIFDIHRRGMEDIGIRVTDMEASQGSIRFFARAVEELSRGAG